MSRRAWLLFAAMGVIWGIPYLLIKVAVRHVEPSVLVEGRTLIGALILVPVALSRGQLRPVLARWRVVLAYTVAEMALPWLLLSFAERRLASSVTGLLTAAVPLVGLGVARVAGASEHLDLRRWTGLLLGLGGVGAIVGFDLHGAPVALAEMALVVTGYAIGPRIVAHSLSDVPALGVAAVSVALCALGYLPVALVQLPGRPPPVSAIGAIVGLGVVCTALAFVLFFALIGEVGPVRATVITYVNPAVAVLLGHLVLSEPVTAATGVGFALVIGGCVLSTGAGSAPGSSAGRGQTANPAPLTLGLPAAAPALAPAPAAAPVALGEPSRQRGPAQRPSG